MMPLKIIFIPLLSILFALTPSFAGITTPRFENDADVPVHIVADLLQYSDQHTMLLAKGDAIITQGSRTIRADSITLNLESQEAEAQGNVVLTQNGDTIACESFTINLDTQVGIIHQAKIFIKNENLHIQGREIQKTGPNTYIVHNGTITTCDGDNPPWRIEAAHIDVEIEGYAVARHPLFRVKGIPVMYLPIAVMPVKLERQTGFLMPEIGYSSRSGVEIDNSFFWAINNQSDATFWLDTASKQGIGLGAEYRIKLAEQTDAKLYGYFSSETGRYQDDRYRDILDREHQRYYLNFEGQHYFDADMYMKADVSQVSDRQFYYDYRHIPRRSRGGVSRNDARNYEKEESSVFFNKNWDSSNLLVNMNWYRDLRDRNPDTVQALPEVHYSTMLQPIAGTPLFYQFETAYNHFWRRDTKSQRGQRFTMYPQLAMPMLMGGWLKFTPKVGMRGVYFFDLNRSQGTERDGIFPTVDINLATSFVRVFNIDGKQFKKLRHMIEPGLEYTYVGSDQQSDFPYFDDPDNYYRRHQAGYYLKNRFTALLRDATGELTEREVGYFKIGHLFNFVRPQQGLYYDGSRNETSSDIFTETRLDLHQFFYLKAKTYYNVYEQRLRRYNIMASLQGARNNSLRLEYRYWRDLYEYLELSSFVHVTNWLALFVNTRYDYLDNDSIDTDVGFEYHSQCWGLRVWFEQDGGSTNSRSESTIKSMFFLKGFGDRYLF
jgi:LPS-assembly protein